MMIEGLEQTGQGGAWLAVLPMAYAAGAVLTLLRLPGGPWRYAHLAGWLVAGLAALSGLRLVLTAGVPVATEPGWLGILFRADAVSVTMQGLIGLIGLILLRFSRNYLAGDPGERRFAVAFLSTLACVATLVASNHLVLLAAAWIGSSLSLHRLLVFYGDRPAALLAAHKKFLIARVGDICLLAGLYMLGQHFGSMRLDEILPAARDLVMTTQLQVACVLLAITAILKCAQLPFHGWLIQVMEAPTPVSALLHAGIINIGGFLMIRLAPVVSQAEVAQALLVIVGTLSAVIAGLIMMTRISVKVMLAWSTCAQMGFMLMECGLGAYSLAMLHLLAHSLYKAYAFLSSGRTVTAVLQRRAVASHSEHQVLHWVTAMGIAVLGVAGLGWAFGLDPASEPAIWALGAIICVASATLMAEGMAAHGIRAILFPAGSAALLCSIYFAWHYFFITAYEAWVPTAHPEFLLVAFVILAFLGQYALLAWIRLSPASRAVRRLHALLYHGLYLDELFSWATFKIWPQPAGNR